MSILLMPLRLVWAFICFLFNLTGRFLGIVLGLVLMVIGLILAFTIVGAVIGIPLAILGFLLIARSMFK